MNGEVGTVADAIEFDRWTPEQKRIARAGIAIEERITEERSKARSEGFDAGKAAGLAEASSELKDKYEDVLAEAYTKLRLLIPRFAPADSRVDDLREITALISMNSAQAAVIERDASRG